MKSVFLNLMVISFVFFSERAVALTPSPEVSAMLESVSALQMENTMRIFSSFHTRHHNHPEARKAQRWLKANWEWIAQDRSDIQVEYFYHPAFTRMPSLILTIEGCSTPEEIIVLGAHADSAVKEVMGTPVTDETMDVRSPGADDNASGIAVLTEVLRVMVDHGYCPAKTVMLMAYAAEEIGLKGSEHIANTFAEEGRNVVGTINFDLTNFRGSPDIDFAIINDPKYTDPDLIKSIVNIAGIYLPRASWTYVQCNRDCSDHASWANAGFPATMLVESRLQGINPHFHKTTDTFEASGGNADHSVTFAQLALAYIAETN